MPHGTALVLALFATALLGGGCQRPDRSRPTEVPLAVRGSIATLEIAPVLLAAQEAGLVVRDGGIANLFAPPPDRADVATHAETQALRYSVAHPDLRIVLTVTEGRYRIVARRSAGIATVADLKGKRIATLPTTSAGYFLARMLGEAKLGIGDVETVRITPIGNVAAALATGRVDAVALWEPHAGEAARAIGNDAIAFSGGGYTERFNLNTTADRLADADTRGRIIKFVRGIISAAAVTRRDGTRAQVLAEGSTGFAPDVIRRAWPTLGFPASLAEDLLDVLVAEEAWLAAQDGRVPRSRAILAELIDPTIEAEARAR